MQMVYKITLREDTQARINEIQEVWGFNRHGGTDQIPAIAKDFAREHGRPEDEHPAILLQAAIAFGKYMELLRLAERHDFCVDATPEGFVEYVIYLNGIAYSRYRRRGQG